jgi:hypothetical protein
LEPGFGERLQAPGGFREILRHVNSLGLTALLFSLVSSLQITNGFLQANPAILLVTLVAATGLMAVKMAASAWASSGQYALKTEERAALKTLSGVAKDSELTFATRTETGSNGLLSGLIAPLVEYRMENGRAQIVVGDNLARILFELSSRDQLSAWERLQFGTARALFRSSLLAAMRDYSVPQAEGTGVASKLVATVGRELTVQALEKGTTVFSTLVGLSTMVVGGLLAVLIGAPVMAVALPLGVLAGGMAMLYALTVQAHYDLAENDRNDFSRMQAERANSSKYQTDKDAIALDLLDVIGAARSALEANQAPKLGAEAVGITNLLEKLNTTGYGKRLRSLESYLKRQTFEKGSMLEALQSAVQEADSLSGKQKAAVLNAAVASLLALSQGKAGLPVKADATELAGKKVYLLNTPALMSALAQQARAARAAVPANLTGANVQALEDMATGLESLVAQMKNETPGAMVALNDDVKAKLLPYVQGFAQQSGQSQFAEMGQDFDVKNAVRTGGHTLEPMEVAPGVNVDMPVSGVYELTSRKPVTAEGWMAMAAEQEVQVRNYFQERLQGVQAARSRGAGYRMMNRLGNALANRNFIGRAANQLALTMNREEYLLSRAEAMGVIVKQKDGSYQATPRSLLGTLLADPASGLRDLMSQNDLDLVSFQREMLQAQIRVLKTHAADEGLMKEVVVFMNHLAPSAGVVAGKINNQPFLLPNLLWGKGMRSSFGYMKDYLYNFNVILDPKMEQILIRQQQLSASQSA